MRVLLVPLLGLVACVSGATYTISVSPTTPLEAKPPTCDFRGVSLAPTGDGYEKSRPTPSSGLTAGDPERFKESVHDDVCRVGGDIVVTDINGQGSYMRATVLRARPVPHAAQP